MGLTGSGAESLLRGIASLLWPAVVFLGLLLFKDELKDVLRRLRKGRFLGQEIEVDKPLAHLEAQVEELEGKPIPAVATADPTEAAVGQAGGAPGTEGDEIVQIFALAAISPRAALMQLAASLEREARKLLAATGHLGEVRGAGLSRAAEVLERVTAMPRGSLGAFQSFTGVRNAIAHGGHVGETEIMRAIDSGVVLLRSLYAVPRERNVVYHSGVDVFADPTCAVKHPGKGLILETTSPGGATMTHRIFPTTRSYYLPGMEVTWEWSNSEKWPDAWYKDPDSGQVLLAWNSSMEFVGRDLGTV